jgi:cyclopropane fatty-acyl-phospholipid synthase-like methyltransferase
MNDSIDKLLSGLLLLIDRVHQAGRPLGRETLIPVAEIKLPRVADHYDALVGSLLGDRFIQGNADAFELTPDGLHAITTASQQYSLHALFYDEYYQAAERSQAHALFCEQAYGKNLCQHGMADMAQLQIALDKLQVRAGMTLLDFGCGDGRIAEYISDTTHAAVTGVDIASRAIELAQMRTLAKREWLHFYWADVERQRGSFPPDRFDRILAIDSIFFVRDQQAVTQVLLDHLAPGGRLGLFYLCPTETAADETNLAVAMKNLNVPYHVIDLSAQNKVYWINKKRVLLELEAQFNAEDNEFLFKNRIAECDGLEDFQRYLYVVVADRD